MLSCKTRPLRPGEYDGVDYYYLTAEQFQTAIQHDEFLEYAQVHHAYNYGTRKADLEKALQTFPIVIKEIDLQ